MSFEQLACDGNELFALQVLGHDMEDEFPDKCIVMIQHFEEKIPDSYVMAEVDGIKWFRQYKIDDNGREYLSACNEIYPDIELYNIDWKVLGIIRQRNIRRKVKNYTYSNE
ncbi:MAG: S24 family peptidase [Planctomycetaceae bacterium]|nr:S24 family peptidase [Planctomycetaceae bacterium]